LLLSIAYPTGTSFKITAYAAYCSTSQQYSCQESFRAVNSTVAVRKSTGNTCYFSKEGLLTLRIIQTPQTYVGTPSWFLPKYTDIGKWGNGYAIPRFERGGVLLPGLNYGPWLDLVANCPASATNSVYCSQMPPNLDPKFAQQVTSKQRMIRVALVPAVCIAMEALAICLIVLVERTLRICFQRLEF
jgi:hypothetical protein